MATALTILILYSYLETMKLFIQFDSDNIYHITFIYQAIKYISFIYFFQEVSKDDGDEEQNNINRNPKYLKRIRTDVHEEWFTFV